MTRSVAAAARGRADWRLLLFSWLALPGALLAALLVGAVMMLAFGANPLDGYRALLTGAFGKIGRAHV